MSHATFFKAPRCIALILVQFVCLFGPSRLCDDGKSPASWLSRILFPTIQDPGFRWILLICLTVWFAASCFEAFKWSDLLLFCLWMAAVAACFPGAASPIKTNFLILLFGITLGKCARFLLNPKPKIHNDETTEHRDEHSETTTFLIVLILMLAFSAGWHLDKSGTSYHGPRWMGLWSDPNTYGMLMGTGTTLTIALQVSRLKLKVQSPKSQPKRNLTPTYLSIAAAMTGVGLVMSYSRGAWLGTAAGLLYLSWNYGKIKWRFVAAGMVIVAAGAFYFWGGTPDSAPWYIKRADLGRPSAQHRVTAWRAGLQIMRDHPLGVGWNNAVGAYAKSYSPPEGGAGAITTNDYLMLGTESGIAALLCFVSYVALCLRGKLMLGNEEGRIQAACRAGAIALLVGFWFDGGLFKLTTASMFWIFLELGRVDRANAKRPNFTHLLLSLKSSPNASCIQKKDIKCPKSAQHNNRFLFVRLFTFLRTLQPPIDPGRH
jgi:O-antigen ligase/polysaccharide polymerase Wzy-like membrane protein